MGDDTFGYLYGSFHGDAAYLNILTDVLKLKDYVGHSEYHCSLLEVILLQVQMHVSLAAHEQQQTRFGQLIDLALTEERLVRWPTVEDDAEVIVIEHVTLGSGHLLQVNGVDREVIDALTVAHNDIIVRFRCKISVFR